MTTPSALLEKLFPPMLATLADAAPTDPDEWTFELKYDGFRAVVAICDGEIAVWSRNQLDLSARFPRVTAALQKLKIPEVVLDGEIVALDESGTPRFQLLQQGERRETMFVFDILWLDGRDLRKLPYVERRALLETLIGRRRTGIVAVSQRIKGDGAAALAAAAKDGWEGIIAKKNTSVYEPRRSKSWLKIKAIDQQEFAIVGWQPSTHSELEIGSLHLGYMDDDGRFSYAGKVGTGFSAKLRAWFLSELSKDVISKPAVEDAPRIRTATWVTPRLVGQVSFTEWTADGKLRHPSFLGLRDDKAPAEVVREKPQPVKAEKKAAVNKKAATKPARASKAEVARKGAEAPAVLLTNPQRLLYPRDGYTKEDVAAYYEAVAAPMIYALRDRPLSLEHWNSGIDKPSWFHQHLGREAADWLTLIETPTRTSSRTTVKHLVIDRPVTLRWVAQMSALTIHMWSSHAPTLDAPDWVVFDLDPAKGHGIEQAIEAAIVMRKVLDSLELPSVPKTSGKRGIHVFVPLAPGHTHEEAGDFSLTLATAVCRSVPGMTVERSLAKRDGRLYLDAIQNAYGKTIVAPYSLRAIDGAPVSAPLEWSEVTKKLDPLKYNIRTMPNRLAKMGDLFGAVFENRARLPQLK